MKERCQIVDNFVNRCVFSNLSGFPWPTLILKWSNLGQLLDAWAAYLAFPHYAHNSKYFLPFPYRTCILVQSMATNPTYSKWREWFMQKCLKNLKCNFLHYKKHKRHHHTLLETGFYRIMEFLVFVLYHNIFI